MNVNSMSAIAMRMPLALTLLEASVATATLASRETESTAQVSETMESSCPLYPLLCLDIDECELGFDDCNENATCTDTVGSFSCTCNLGYSGDGLNCTSKHASTVFVYMCEDVVLDIDECALGTDNCDVNADCADTIGSFNCTCNIGYLGNGITCSM